MKKVAKHQGGFTLIELLVVIAILGILAAIVIPNISKFIGAGKMEAAATEKANIQTIVLVAMVDQKVGVIAGGPLSKTQDLVVGSSTVGAFISGGIANLHGVYTVATDGTVRQISYP